MKSFLDSIPRLDLEQALSDKVSSEGTVGLEQLQELLGNKRQHTDYVRQLNKSLFSLESHKSVTLKPYQQVTLDEANFIASKSTSKKADSVIVWLIDCKNERNRLLEANQRLEDELAARYNKLLRRFVKLGLNKEDYNLMTFLGYILKKAFNCQSGTHVPKGNEDIYEKVIDTMEKKSDKELKVLNTGISNSDAYFSVAWAKINEIKGAIKAKAF